MDAELGRRLRAFRKAAGLNQAKLAGSISLTFQQIQKYESGTNRISATTLFEFAHVLGVDVPQFFEGLKPTSRKPKVGEIAKAPKRSRNA
jgi:transcriptional regulator with XRE-family HTH domain